MVVKTTRFAPNDINMGLILLQVVTVNGFFADLTVPGTMLKDETDNIQMKM